jgi:cytidylate kinase
MVIGIFGESCTGKSTLAEKIAAGFPCEIYTGKDYLRLAKNENIAKVMFQKKLTAAINGTNIIYVIAEKEHLPLLPEGAVRILVTAELDTIKERFAQRMRGNLPAPVAAMLEKKHGCFDREAHDYHVIAEETDLDAFVAKIK